MNRTFLWAVIAVPLISSVFTSAACAEPSVVGLWEQADDRGRVQAWFSFFEKNGVYAGAIARTFPVPGEESQDICEKCPGDQKNAPMIGLVIVNGMQRKGLSYENGSILDPRYGTTYRALMELSPDGQKLTVRGFIGLEWLGQSQVWRRLPDNALSPAAGPPGAGRRPAGTAIRPD